MGTTFFFLKFWKKKKLSNSALTHRVHPTLGHFIRGKNIPGTQLKRISCLAPSSVLLGVFSVEDRRARHFQIQTHVSQGSLVESSTHKGAQSEKPAEGTDPALPEVSQ